MSQPDFRPPTPQEIGPISPEVGLVGPDGWVFLGNQHSFERDQALGLYEAADGHIQRLAGWVRGMGDFAARRGIPFLFAIAPAKWSVYDDKVGANGARKPSMQDLLLAELGDRPDVLDLRPSLRDARKYADTYSPLNSHWTDFGAAFAWRTLAERLSTIFPGESFDPFDGPPGFDTVDAMNECQGLMGIQGSNPWTRPTYTRSLPNYDFITSVFDRSPQPGGRQVDLLELPMYTECSAGLSRRRALMFRDSTGSQISPFLTSAFQQTFQVFNGLATLPNVPLLPGNDGLRCSFAGRIDQFNPDVILFLMTERYLAQPVDTDAYWSAEKAFYEAPASADWRWPRDPSSPFLRFDGDVSLAKPALLDLSEVQRHSGESVLRARLLSKGPAAVCFGFTHGNQPHSAWFWLEPGQNQLYFRIPAQIAMGHFWIVRHEHSAEVLLSDLTTRPC